jgi:hypothetical protein
VNLRRGPWTVWGAGLVLIGLASLATESCAARRDSAALIAHQRDLRREMEVVHARILAEVRANGRAIRRVEDRLPPEPRNTSSS